MTKTHAFVITIAVVAIGFGTATAMAYRYREAVFARNETIDLLIKKAAKLNKYLSSAQKQIAADQKMILPTASQIKKSGTILIPHNNPFLTRQKEIRAIKHSAENADELWRRLAPIAKSYHSFGDRRDIVVGAMLVVAAFYDYGNPSPNDSKVGCVSANVTTGFKSVGHPTFRQRMESNIGCCTDYSVLLASFLDYLHVTNTPVSSQVHQAVRVNDDLVDANSLIFAENFYGKGTASISYFTPYPKSRVVPVQSYILKAFAFDRAQYSPDDLVKKPQASRDFVQQYLDQPLRPSEAAKSYEPTGDYYGYGSTRHFTSNTDRVHLDASGFPKIRYGDSFYYNPVTIAQLALAEYSRPGGPSNKFIPAADKLLSLQSLDGSFRYNFAYTKYVTGEQYKPGWISGMAQGQALSVFARAYHLTGDDKYLTAGKKALAFMQVDRSRGGPATTLADLDPSLSGHPFIMEYPQDPAVYTLNGYMFAIQGLYDWHAITGDAVAGRMFSANLNTLLLILPKYDMGDFSAYDLAYLTYPRTADGERRLPHAIPPYHAVHIEQLWALYHLTGDIILKKTADRWLGYVQNVQASAVQ